MGCHHRAGRSIDFVKARFWKYLLMRLPGKLKCASREGNVFLGFRRAAVIELAAIWVFEKTKGATSFMLLQKSI
jgi:hypothetical protein